MKKSVFNDNEQMAYTTKPEQKFNLSRAASHSGFMKSVKRKVADILIYLFNLFLI